MTHATYADILQPEAKSRALGYNSALILAGSWALALAAQVGFYIPPIPVPFTLQTFVVLLAGMLLGSKRGLACVMAYLVQGAAGLPFFKGGASGLSYMTGATFGYLIGFAFAAWLVGRLAERGWDRKPVTTLAALSLGAAAILIPGVVWLVAGLRLDLATAMVSGALIFIPGDALKIALAACLLPMGWRWIGKRS